MRPRMACFQAAFLIFGLITGHAFAEVALPGLFSDHMVLQRDQPVPVWGIATAGQEVTVSVAGQKKQGKADADGRWQVKLDPMKAGGPHTLVVQGSNTVEVKDVLVGEVWLCSGQSNMAMRVANSANAKEEIAAADLPQIRMSKVGQSWAVCSPKSVGGFSATAYFFGRELHETLKVPVGLINSSVGGTPIEHWFSVKDQQALYQTKPVKQWLESTGKKGRPGTGQLYERMIAPLAPYGVRGAIWYQGERNSRTNPYLYRYQLPALIANWRRDWQQNSFPFLFVQLPNFRTQQSKPVEPDGWVTVRESMFKTLAVPDTGMATTIDLGEARDIHPKNKQGVGKRLALWALGTTYGHEIVYSGPLYKSSKQQDGKIMIEFEHAESGLKTSDGKPVRGFAVCGKDRKFVFAQAKIVGTAVEVSSPDVPNPVAVRYAWAANPDCNLTNEAGLPAAPLRTDHWQ